MDLSLRKQEILKEVISSFIATGEPVGSRTVMERMKTPVSAATIRNEMNDLTKLGLLEQPHTSAGRVPTGRGYRLYVDSLMEEYRLSFEESLLLHSLVSSEQRETDEILSDMTALLAKMTGYCAATFVKSKTGTVEHFEGVPINPHSFLLVLVTSEGKAVTKQLNLQIPLDRKQVAFIIQVLNDHLAKKELGGVTLERMVALEKELGDYKGLIGPLLQIIYDMIAKLGKVSVKVKGASGLLAYPEFCESGVAASILRELEDEDALLERFYQEDPGRLRVRIGTDGVGLDRASLVMCPFRLGKREQVTACIIGPRRMDYARAMARLEYLAKQLHAAHGLESHLPLIETKEEQNG